MRLTTALALALLAPATACVAPVGSYGTDAGSGSDDGRESQHGCKKHYDNITLEAPEDFDSLPTGCWDLWANLTVKGTAITSLSKLGDLVGTNDFTLDGTSVAAIDVAQPFTVYGKLQVTSNTKLANLKNVLVDKPEGIEIQNNSVLVTIDKVGDLTETTGDATENRGSIVLDGNAKLGKVAFPNLTAISGDSITVTNNASMSLIDFSKVETVKHVTVTNNIALTSFGGLNTTQMNGNLTIKGNPVLVSLGTMSVLEQILGVLTIDGNNALASVSGFTNAMKYVTAGLVVTNNGNLTDLGQLSHLQGIGAIQITNNTNLSQCRAQEVAMCVPQHLGANTQYNKTESPCTYWCQMP
jgi:hypothetical protein